MAVVIGNHPSIASLFSSYVPDWVTGHAMVIVSPLHRSVRLLMLCHKPLDNYSAYKFICEPVGLKFGMWNLMKKVSVHVKLHWK